MNFKVNIPIIIVLIAFIILFVWFLFVFSSPTGKALSYSSITSSTKVLSLNELLSVRGAGDYSNKILALVFKGIENKNASFVLAECLQLNENICLKENPEKIIKIISVSENSSISSMLLDFKFTPLIKDNIFLNKINSIDPNNVTVELTISSES